MSAFWILTTSLANGSRDPAWLIPQRVSLIGRASIAVMKSGYRGTHGNDAGPVDHAHAVSGAIDGASLSKKLRNAARLSWLSIARSGPARSPPG